jgi:hypothetical protein
MTLGERDQAIMACSKDPFFFGNVVAPQYFFKEFAPLHRAMVNEVNDRPKGCNMVVLEVPRGFGKSIVVSTLNPLHRCIFRKLKYVVVASYSCDRANLIIGDFKNIIKGQNFQGLFPGTIFVKDREDLIEIKNDDLGFNFQIMARGRNSQVAGMRFEEARPQIFIGDDLESPDESYNQKLVDDNVRFVNEVVQYGLDSEIGYSILIGTPFAFDCTTQRFTRNYPRGVRTVMYPALVSDVPQMGNRKGMTAEEMSAKLGVPIGHSIWEDKFSTETLLRERDDAIANGTIDHFMRQRMLDPRSEGSIRIPIEKMHRIPADKIDELMKQIQMNIYILSDYAYSRKIWADESAYMVLGIDDESNHYILESDAGKWGDVGTTDKIIDKVMEYKSKLRTLGVESRGMGFIEGRINELKRNHNLSFGLEELKPRNRAKSERIKSTIAMIEDGRVFIVDGKNRKFEEQASRFHGEEMNHGDDILDCWGYSREDFIHKPVTQKSEEEKLKAATHLFFERWAKSQPDYEKKRSEQTRRVQQYACGMRPSDF